jgi:fibronectin-binding autotransporter adhesin
MRNYVQGKSWPERSRSIAAYRNILNGTVALLALAGAYSEHANAASFNVGGGTITTTDADNFVDNTGTGGSFQLQANSTTPGDLVTISGVTINNGSTSPTAIDIGTSLPSSGTYTVRMNGSLLSGQTTPFIGVFYAHTSGGTVTLDTTGGAPNTISGYYGYHVAAGGGGVVIKTGADVITAEANALFADGQVGAPVSIDSIGASLTSTNQNAIQVVGDQSPITIGASNGGFASSIISPNGYGIISVTSGGMPTDVTIAATGSIVAKGGMLLVSSSPNGNVSVRNFGTINASSDAAITVDQGSNLTVTLESGSTTNGLIQGGLDNTNINIVTGANIAGTSFAGGGPTGQRINLRGTLSGTFDISAASGITELAKEDSGTWTLTRSAGAGASTAAFSVTAGTLIGSTETLAGNVSIGSSGTLRFDQGTSASYGSIISGNGTLQKTNSGTLTLTGNNTFAGNTTISAGTLQLGNGGTTGAITGNVTNNGTLAFNRSDAIVFSGTISGSGTVAQNGTGTVTLTAANTYTGPTNVNVGVLQAGIANAFELNSAITVATAATFDLNGFNQEIGSLAGGGNVTLVNATLRAGRNNSSTVFSGVISGSGAFIKSGIGTLTLIGNNIYTGGTTIFAGTLQLGNGGTTGAIAGNVTTFGTLAFNRSDTIAFSGMISGIGAVVKNGTGTVTLTAANTYTGATNVNAGTLRAGIANAFGSNSEVTVATGATFDLNGFSQAVGQLWGGGNVTLGNATLSAGANGPSVFSGVISGGGALIKLGTGTLTLAGNNTYTGSTTIAAGTLQLGNGGTTGAVAGNVANNGTLIFNRSNDYLFAGVISGTGGVVQNGTGVTTLSATNTYTGATVVNAGTLVVNGSLAASSGVTVNAGGTLLGTGTVARTTINGGTLAPGNSIGTVTVNGNLTFTGNSTYAVEVAPNAADLTTVTGVATVAGTLQAAALGGTYTPGTQYTVINAAGGVSGTFGALTLAGDFTTAVRPRIAYDATRVYLVLDPNLLSPFLSGATANETAAAMALDQVFLGGNAPSPFLSLFGLSSGALNAAVASFSGEIHASTRTAALDDSRFVREAVMKRLSAGIASDNMTQDGNEIWGVAFGSWGHTASDGNAARFDRNIGGFLAGIDRTVGGAWRFGLAGGYSYSGGTAAGLIGSKNDSTGHVAAYAGGAMGPWRLRLGAANAWNNFSTDRVAAFTGFSDRLRADYTGRTTQVFGEAGFHMDFDRLPVEPFVGFTYVNLHTDSFRESGGAAALNGIAASNNVTFSTLGVRSGNMFGLMEGMVSVHGVLAWQHAYETGAPRSSLALASANASFFAAGAPIAQDSALIQVGAGMNLSPGVNVSLDYTGRFASGFSDNGVKAYASWRF